MEREERIRHQKEFLIKFAYWAVWGGLVLAAVKLIGPVLLPFIAAFFVAWILSFPVVFVTERMHIRRGIAAVAVVLLFYGLAGLLVGFLGNRIVLLGQELLGEVVRFVSETIFPMMKHFCAWTAGLTGETVGGEVLRTAGTESAEAVSRAGELLTGMSGTLLQQVSGIAVNIPGMCFKLLLAVISTVFMELDFPQIMRFLEKIIPEKWKETVLAVKKGTFGTMGKCAAAYVFIFLMTSMAFLRALRISTLVSSPIFLICFCDSVSDRGVRYSASARHGNRAASVGGDCVCRRQCQNGNRGDRAVSDHHSGAQHCGAEAGGKTDGAFSGRDAAVYDCRASFLWNLRTVRRAASGIVFEKTLQ